MRELLAMLWDSLRTGDLRGHLAVWWMLITKRIKPEDRWTVVSAPAAEK